MKKLRTILIYGAIGVFVVLCFLGMFLPEDRDVQLYGTVAQEEAWIEKPVSILWYGGSGTGFVPFKQKLTVSWRGRHLVVGRIIATRSVTLHSLENGSRWTLSRSFENGSKWIYECWANCKAICPVGADATVFVDVNYFGGIIKVKEAECSAKPKEKSK